MSKTFVRRFLALGLVALLGFSLAGCGSKVEGKYAGDPGVIVFKSGKATFTPIMGGVETMDYTVDGDQISLKSKDVPATLTLTIMKDGSLQGIGGTFKKSAD